MSTNTPLRILERVHPHGRSGKRSLRRYSRKKSENYMTNKKIKNKTF